MFIVVPFKKTDEGGDWGWPKCAMVEGDSVEDGTDKFVEAAVYPSADSYVWGKIADCGSSPEQAEGHHYYIVGPPDSESDEGVCIDLSIDEDRARAFETEEQAEQYRDREIKTHKWVFTSTEADEG